MSEIESSSAKSTGKRILLVTLFVVPFLAGMALIFMGKGIGTLPFLHPIVAEDEESKFYTVPELKLTNRSGEVITLSPKDSVIRLFCLFDRLNQLEWGKHLMYVSKIVSRYNNMEVWSVYEGFFNPEDWTEDPSDFIAQQNIWSSSFLEVEQFEKVRSALKLHKDSLTKFYPYVIVDKEHHIRAYCPINDLKQARDVPKMMKILNNQYAPRKPQLEKKR